MTQLLKTHVFTAAACLAFCVGTMRAGVVTITYTLQQGNEQTNGVAYGSGTSYSGVVDGSISDNTTTSARTTAATSTIGNQYASGSPNGRTWCGLFSYDLTDLNNLIAANTGSYSSVAIQSVSFQLVSAGSQSATSGIRLFSTDPFTSSANWSTTDGSTAWSSPFQNIGSSALYGYTGGASALGANLGGGTSPTTGITSGNPLTWNSSAGFITAIQNALARSDKKLYLTADVAITAYSGGTDQRLNVNYSPTTTVANRPQLTITLQITTTAAPTTWTGASDTSWATAGNWSPGTVPLTDSPIIFNSSSSAHLNTVLNQNFTILSLSVTNPTGPVSIGGANSLTVDSGGINLSAATQDLTISAPVVLGVAQTWSVTNTHALSVNGGVSGSVALTVSGGGKVSLGGAATHTGDTTVSSGSTFQMGADNVLPNLAGGGNVNVNGVLDLNGHPGSLNGLNGSGVVDNTAVGAATLTVGNNNTNSSFSGTITNTGGALALVKTGTGSLTLSGTNTYSGGTTIANGTVTPGNGSAFGTGTITNFALAYPAATMTITNSLVLNGGKLELGGNNDNAIWSGPVTVTNGFQMSGDNGNCQMFLSGPMDIGTGGISITNGGNNGAAQGGLGDTLSGTISGSGGITYYVNGGSSRLTVQSANTYSGDTVVNGTSNGKLNVYGGSNPFSTGTVTLNAGAVIEAYPGNVTITNALTLNGGSLQGESQYNNYNRLTWSGPITLTANSTLFQFGQNSGQMSQGVNVSGSLNMNGYTLTNSGNLGLYNGSIISGPINGTGTILEAINILYLQGSNTFSGTFRAVGGTLSVQNVYALQNATLDMNAADAGTVSLSTNVLIGALTGSRSLNLGGFAISVGNNNSSTAFTGALTNIGSITKVGTGTLTLSGANTYTGSTTISAGTLALSGSGSLASPTISVSGGGTFDTSAGSFTLGSGQVLSNSASATASLVGPMSSGSGTISVSFVNGTPALNVADSTVNLSASTLVAVDNTGATLAPGTYKIISKSGSGAVGGAAPTSVSVVNGPATGTPSVSIVGGELYLTVGGTSTFGYSGASFTYDGSGQSPAISFSGSTATTTTNYVGVSASYGPSANAPTNAGTYYVTNTVSADANYFGTANSHAFTISTAAASVTANPQTKNYGDVNPTLTATVVGQVNGGDTLNYTLATDATRFSAVGVSNITVTLGSNPNYSVLTTNSTLTINPASTLVGADSVNSPSGYRDSVAFLATLPADATGNVVYSATNVLDASYEPFSTNAVSGVTTTSLSITNLPRGTNLVTVVYLGDRNYLGSTNTLNQIVTNHPPVALDATYYRAKGIALKIAITNLLTNVTDVDADTIGLDSVGAGFTNAIILTDSDYVYYEPGTGTGSNENDVVSYTVIDGFGGTNTANILVNVYNAEGAAQMSLPTNGVVNITFFGIPTYTYVVQTTTNLTTPWWPLSTNTAGTDGTWLFTDPNATNAQQYYRSVQP